MPPETVSALISIAGVLVSAIVAAFVAGSRWGGVSQQVHAVAQKQDQTATRSDVQQLSERIARIEGMFELKLRDGSS